MLQVLKTKKKSDKKHSKTVVYCMAALKGFILFAAGILLISLLVMKSSSDSFFYYIAGYILLALGGFVSGFSAYKKLKGRGFQNGIIASSVYFAVIFALITVCMRFDVSGRVLLTLPIAVGGGFLGGIIGANT